MSKIIDIIKSNTLNDKLIEEFNSSSTNLHAYNIEYLLTNADESINLQLDNLILTYGIAKIKKVLETKCKVKKVG